MVWEIQLLFTVEKKQQREKKNWFQTIFIFVGWTKSVLRCQIFFQLTKSTIRQETNWFRLIWILNATPATAFHRLTNNDDHDDDDRKNLSLKPFIDHRSCQWVSSLFSGLLQFVFWPAHANKSSLNRQIGWQNTHTHTMPMDDQDSVR